ncbi:conserved hypothetical protein [Azorhizobium caulinodans ORS 571]|uniref:Uncharacterized protein n=1 Tax=Azorhizobium caulinodans (strain ATCC 43989 / DSM 5975 / JCM 20966 / LMG 6465 / NBRC 14845 / NCIMB 13405 / ORS 571) TaxID=438753 RepID=A8HTM0_AZOC5|nr:hypothetical protein [Azorhizobium caulinodans]BAF86849.1 conserved hypothetical protein [Azorhizobium caulinodans ORS 571]
MPIFEVQAPDGRSFEVDAPDINAAAAALKQFGAKPAAPDPRDSVMGKIDAAVRGAADLLSGGVADEFAAGADALFNPVFGTGQDGGSFSERYDKNLAAQRGIDKADEEKRGSYRLAGQIAGGIAGGAGLAKSGLSAAANAAQAGGGIFKVAGGSALDGAVMGALQGFGSGEGGIGNRAEGAGLGLAAGGALGAALPFAISGVTTAAKPLVAPIMARLRPQEYADAAVAEALRRSGMTADSVAGDLAAARAAGQDVYTTADALGNAGQRMLSTAARNPQNERQALVDFLQSRQAGQGRRISGALADAFDAPDTAAQRAATLTGARDAAADVNYAAAREGAYGVDVGPALARIDEVLQPGLSRFASTTDQIAPDSVEGALSRARSLLTDGKSNLTEFSAVLRAKQDIDDMIGRATRSGAGNQARLLMGVKQELEAALENASEPYAAARNAFRQGSREIDAVDAGRVAAQRGRSQDTIPAFQGMTSGEQAAFRAGYADPLIEQVQSAAIGANKARPLMSDATAAEFPAFAAPGRADQLGQRLAREARMFETNQAALGGSKTADNLADAADMARFDPSVMTNLLRGRPVEAAISALTKGMNEAKGMPPTVLEQITRTLMETRPDMAKEILSRAWSGKVKDRVTQGLANSILLNVLTAGAGRAAAP